MSLLNCWISPTEAIVAVDTDGVTTEGVHRPMSKLVGIAHLNVVIAARGSAALLSAMYHLAVGSSSFEQLLGELPNVVRAADALSALQRHADFPDVELVVVGWSPSKQQMVGALCTKHGEGDFACKATGGCISPMDPATMAEIPLAPEHLQALARAQVRYLQEQVGLGGGALVVANLTRDSVSIKHMTLEETPCLQ